MFREEKREGRGGKGERKEREEKPSRVRLGVVADVRIRSGGELAD